MRTVLPAILVALAASACGQKGPLFLRDEPPPGYQPKAETYRPVPYPSTPDRDERTK